jgi:hypothetical protein
VVCGSDRSGRWSTGRHSSGSWARSMPRPSGGRRTARWCCSSACCCSSGTGCLTRARGGAVGPAELPALRRFRLGRRGAGSLDPVALSQRAEPARPGTTCCWPSSTASSRKGLMVKSGTLIDASLVAADCPGRARASRSKAAAIPTPAGTRCPSSRCFGYQMHLAVDHGSGLVRRAILTPGHVSGKAPFLELSRATSGRCTRIGAMTAPGIGRAWSSGASPTASCPATTGSGRSMPRAAPATGRSE